MITLHHLNQSRSKRIIWLLEELGVDYNIVSYQRDPNTHLAPAALKQLHPLGKSPVIQDGDLVVAESGAIVEYLVSQYGADTLAPAINTAQYTAYQQWLHFAEGSAALPMLLGYFLQLDGGKTNFLEGYAQQEMTNILSYLNQELAHKTYLLGEQFTGADILNSFVLEQVNERKGLQDFPHVQAYLKTITARPACQKANQLEAEYDKTVF